MTSTSNRADVSVHTPPPPPPHLILASCITSTSQRALELVAAVADVRPVVRRKTCCFFLYSSPVKNFSCSAWNSLTTSPWTQEHTKSYQSDTTISHGTVSLHHPGHKNTQNHINLTQQYLMEQSHYITLEHKNTQNHINLTQQYLMEQSHYITLDTRTHKIISIWHNNISWNSLTTSPWTQEHTKSYQSDTTISHGTVSLHHPGHKNTQNHINLTQQYLMEQSHYITLDTRTHKIISIWHNNIMSHGTHKYQSITKCDGWLI